MVSTSSKIKRAIMHVPVGFLTGFCCAVGWQYGLLFGFGFLAYEIMQDWRIKDRSYLDVFGWLIGLPIFVIFRVIMEGV